MVAPLALASIVETLADLAAPWQHVYEDSKALSIGVVFLHLAALLVGGGIALAADRTTLRLASETGVDRDRHLVELSRTHRPVIMALGLSFVTGVLLFFSDVETFAVSPIFWGKMALVALLLVNGLAMQRAERALRSGIGAGPWGRLRLMARLSGALWLLTLLAGTALTNV